MEQDIYAQIALRIIKGQEAIIGPMAVEQAKQVDGLEVDWKAQTVTVVGDKVAAIEELIQQYKDLFGHISVEVSKQAAASLMGQLPQESLPLSLR